MADSSMPSAEMSNISAAPEESSEAYGTFPHGELLDLPPHMSGRHSTNTPYGAARGGRAWNRTDGECAIGNHRQCRPGHLLAFFSRAAPCPGLTQIVVLLG